MPPDRSISSSQYQKIISDNHGDYDISYVQNEYLEQLDPTEYVGKLESEHGFIIKFILFRQ